MFAKQRIGTAIAACCAALALGATGAGAQERHRTETKPPAARSVVVVAFVPAATVLERTDISIGLLSGPPDLRGLTVTAVDAAGLDALLARRTAGELVIAIGDERGLRTIGLAGRPGPPGRLTSRTTRRLGLVAGADVAHPRAIEVDGTRDVAALSALRDRLEAIGPRRVPAALALLATIALAWALAGARVAALTLLWAPTTALAAAALGAPSPPVELAVIGPGAVALAWLTDRRLAWPRALAAPALVGVGAHALDLLLGSDLIARSLLGPDPSRGARFYGIGNELEAILPVLALLGVAALAPRRPAVAFGAVMAALGVVVGAGRLGADAGGVVTVGVAGAVAVLWCRPGRPSRRAMALAAAVPVVALAVLAAIDLATGADTHFSRTILGADSAGDVAGTIGRRYELAWDALLRGLMPLATAAAVAAAVWAVRRRADLYAPVAHLPEWRAALAGSLAGAVAGTLSNDSGPVLLVLGVVVLAAVTAYLRTGATRTEAVHPDP